MGLGAAKSKTAPGSPHSSYVTAKTARGDGTGSDMSELHGCAERFGGLAVTTLPWWDSRSFIRPAYMPSCIRPEVRLPLDQHVLCSDCCKKNVGHYV